MSQTKLQAAHELIQEQEYQAAREILRTMPSNPTAAKWLIQIEQRSSPARRVNRIIAAVLVVIVLASIGLFIASRQEQSSNSRAAREYACSLMYSRYSTEWQNCADDQ